MDIKPLNPFYTGIVIPDAFFCDRAEETESIINLIENGNNVVLKSQRRIGKSSLIHHIFLQKTILEGYNTLYLDLFGTKSCNDFHVAFQNKLLNAAFAHSTKLRRNFEQMVKGINISLGAVDPLTGRISLPSIGTTPSQIPRIPLEELFGYLEKTKKRNLVVFDEFQQIEYYPERMAAILRSHIQLMNNTKFIFSGSSKHMLNAMFMNRNQPFYKSSSNIDLDIIECGAYEQFVKNCFKQYGKSIETDAVRLVYKLFLGETAPMQETMNCVFAMTDKGATVGIPLIIKAVNVILDSKDESFRSLLNQIEKERTRNTLYCIAAQGIASNLTASVTMKRFGLDNASSVQNALIALQDDNNPIVRKLAKGTYIIDNRMFELWIAREGNYLDLKIDCADSRFERQRILECPPINPFTPKD